jgi:hypothetical protein
MTHCINGYLTDSSIEYLIEPSRTSMVISDITEHGYWDDTKYDDHINHCIKEFTNIIKNNPVLVDCMKSSPVIFASGGKMHGDLISLLDSHNIAYRCVKPCDVNYGSSYMPQRNILVWGIHGDLCVLEHAAAIARHSSLTRAIILLDATYNLYASGHEKTYTLARHTPNIDAVSNPVRFVK